MHKWGLPWCPGCSLFLRGHTLGSNTLLITTRYVRCSTHCLCADTRQTTSISIHLSILMDCYASQLNSYFVVSALCVKHLKQCRLCDKIKLCQFGLTIIILTHYKYHVELKVKLKSSHILLKPLDLFALDMLCLLQPYHAVLWHHWSHSATEKAFAVLPLCPFLPVNPPGRRAPPIQGS